MHYGNDPTLHFGLGSHSGTVDVDILCPDGTEQTFTGIETGRVMTIPEHAMLFLLSTGAPAWGLLAFAWRQQSSNSRRGTI